MIIECECLGLNQGIVGSFNGTGNDSGIYCSGGASTDNGSYGLGDGAGSEYRIGSGNGESPVNKYRGALTGEGR